MTSIIIKSISKNFHQIIRPWLAQPLPNYLKGHEAVYRSVTTAHAKYSFTKLQSVSDDADRVLTQKETIKLLEKLISEKEKNPTPPFKGNLLSGDSLSRAGLYFAVISLYLALTSQINNVLENSNDKYDKFKDIINIDIRTKITNLENRTDNLTKELNEKILGVSHKTDGLIQKVDSLDKRTDDLKKKIESTAKK